MLRKQKVKEFFYISYYKLKDCYHNLKKNITQCICPIENENENYNLNEIVVVNNDDSINRMEINKNYSMKYENETSSNEDKDEIIEEQPRKKIKRRHAFKIKKAKYKTFDNNFTDTDLEEKENIKKVIKQKNDKIFSTSDEDDWDIIQ